MNSYNKLKLKYESAMEDIENLSSSNMNTAEKVIAPSSSRITRFNSNIRKWRVALDQVESVESPLYADLIRVFREIDLDSEITSVKTIRKNYVMSRDHFLTKNGEIDETAIDFFKGTWFFDFVNLSLESSYWGYSLIQLGDIVDDKLTGVTLVQRQNVNPQRDIIQVTPYNNTGGMNYTNDKNKNWYILATDTKDDNYTGLYNKLAPYQIMLKTGQIAFSDYAERFGSPNVVVKTNMTDENHLRNVENYLANFDNSSHAIFGDNDEVQLIESGGKSGEVYQTLIKENKSNITKLILGTDTINSEKSFVGSAQISEGIANVYSLNDVKLVENLINNELLPRLVNLGLTFLTDVKFKYDTTNKTNPELEFSQMIELIKNGYDVPLDFITEKFGIPVIEKEEETNEEESNEDE